MNYTENDTDNIIRRLREGDRQAYIHIIEGYESRVRMVLAAVLVDKDSVDDLTQEVFVTVYSKLHDYQLGTDFSSWIKQIARNTALNERRSFIRRLRKVDAYRSAILEEMEPDMLDAGEQVAS